MGWCSKLGTEEHRAMLRYLSMDVPGEECEAACHYEYGREIEELCELAERAGLDDSESCRFLAPEWIALWSCADFPRCPWLALPSDVRQDIMNAIPSIRGVVRTGDLRVLAATGVFNRFVRTGRKALRSRRQPRGKIEPMIMVGEGKKTKGEGIVVGSLPCPVHPSDSTTAWVLLNIDLAANEDDITNDFKSWLKLQKVIRARCRNKRMKQKGLKQTQSLPRIATSRLRDLVAFRFKQNAATFRDGLDGVDRFLRSEAETRQLGKKQAKTIKGWANESSFFEAVRRAQTHLQLLAPEPDDELSPELRRALKRAFGD
jgi:hypothetical protein